MSDFEQSNSEKGMGRISTTTRAQISNYINNRISSKKREEEKRRAFYSNYGTGKYIITGATDRLLGRNSLPELMKQSNFSEEDLRSYSYGYYERGSRNLEIYCIGKAPGYINKKELLAATGYNENEKVTEEKINLAIKTILTRIGYIDSQNPNFEYNKLPEAVKNNPYYNAGYNMAINKTAIKGGTNNGRR